MVGFNTFNNGFATLEHIKPMPYLRISCGKNNPALAESKINPFGEYLNPTFSDEIRDHVAYSLKL